MKLKVLLGIIVLLLFSCQKKIKITEDFESSSIIYEINEDSLFNGEMIIERNEGDFILNWKNGVNISVFYDSEVESFECNEILKGNCYSKEKKISLKLSNSEVDFFKRNLKSQIVLNSLNDTSQISILNMIKGTYSYLFDLPKESTFLSENIEEMHLLKFSNYNKIDTLLVVVNFEGITEKSYSVTKYYPTEHIEKIGFKKNMATYLIYEGGRVKYIIENN